MALELVNYIRKLQLAVFMTAFCFNANAELDFTDLESRGPDSSQAYSCFIRGTFSGLMNVGECSTLARMSFESRFCQGQHGCRNQTSTTNNPSEHKYNFYLTAERCTGINSVDGSCYRWETERATEGEAKNPTSANQCPPATSPEFNYPHDENGDGQPDKCYRTSDVNDLIAQGDKKALDDDYCKGLLLDGGNNSAQEYCYTSPSGQSCTVSKKSTVYGSQTVDYYVGGTSVALGCASTQLPTYDLAGLGDSQDSCMAVSVTNGSVSNFCSANADQKCPNGQCEDGCFQTNGQTYCDVARHPDVGDGQADEYFDDTGTCSIIAGSAYRGLCEDMGGNWDDEEDYQQASCPSSSLAGNCSNGSSTTCYSCIDAGGSWTPESTDSLSITDKGINDLLTLTQSGNQGINALENTARKSGQAIVSATSSASEKVVNAVNETAKKTNKLLEEIKDKQPEKKTFSITKGDKDSSAIDTLFSDTSQLQSEIETLRSEMSSTINSVKSELSSLLTINVTNSGYTVRTLNLTHGSFDVSLSRFSDYFSLIGLSVLCFSAVLALIIIIKD